MPPLELALQSCGADEDDSIKIGAPLSTHYLYGWSAERGIRLAAGGIDVGGRKRRLTVKVLDTRDLEPGVPIDDAIKAVEKLIFQKQVHFLVGGPVPGRPASS